MNEEIKNIKYITPNTEVYLNFSDVKIFFEGSGGIPFLKNDKLIDINAISQGRRSLIIGEPGVGKSLLLEKINERLIQTGEKTEFIRLRENDALERMDKFVDSETSDIKFLLLDGFDEIKSDLFPKVLEKIENIASKNEKLSLFITSRWIFINKYIKSFAEFRYITISPFTHDQVRDYLINAGRLEEDIDSLFTRIMPFNHKMFIIQIPRYLSYLNDFLKRGNIVDDMDFSRNELFEDFIYKKLELEEKKINKDQKLIIKRVLEKLALTMEIYQTNIISRDELMTFFDDLSSDLKIPILSQIGIDVFNHYSLLKDDGDKIEFENTEFQEYLAAKEITRLAEPHRVTFELIIDKNVKEIYPPWFNTLTFLVDMYPELLDSLVEFSTIRKESPRVISENFFFFLSRINFKSIDIAFRLSLFKDIVRYYCNIYQWLPGNIARVLPNLYNSSLEEYLKNIVGSTKHKKKSHRYVPLGNVFYVIAYLLQEEIFIDKKYWKSEIIKYIKKKEEHEVLQRRALQALGEFKDSSIINELSTFDSSNNSVYEAFLSMCTSIDSDHSETLKKVFFAISKNIFHGRYGLYKITKKESVILFLEELRNNKEFRQNFLKDMTIFKRKDKIIVDLIESFADENIINLCKEVFIKSVDYNLTHNMEELTFLCDIWEFLYKKEKNTLILDIIDRIVEMGGSRNLYYMQFFLSKIVQISNVEECLEKMVEAGERQTAFGLMLTIKFSQRLDALAIFEKGRNILSEEYAKWEMEKTQIKENTNIKLLEKFRLFLEPEKGKFSNNVFDFYNNHFKELNPLLTKSDKDRVNKLLSGTIFKFYDPKDKHLKISKTENNAESYTVDSSVFIFGAAIKTAKNINFDMTPYRQKLINFIPFALHEDLEIIFDSVKDIKPSEMKDVFKVYIDKKSDLWKHLPTSFIETIKKYNLIEAVPILKLLIMNIEIEKYARQEALIVLNLLVRDMDFIREIFEKYKESEDGEERKISDVANGLLITSYADDSSIKWRLKQLKNRAAPFLEKKGPHSYSIGSLEDEIYEKNFAKSLINLKIKGYESDYLDLLVFAIELWGRGKDFHAYSSYLWDIVYSYFDNLKEHLSYSPLEKIEKVIEGVKIKDGANWFAIKMPILRQEYLSYIGRPHNIAEAVKKYNDIKEYDNKKIRNSNDLFIQVKDAIEVEIRRFIEDEGAYNFILNEGYKGRKDFETFIQKTIKVQSENIMLKKGFQINLFREVQLYNNQRTDFLVYYGFAGPIVVEIKLTSNPDIKSSNISKIEASPSYFSMKNRYMGGYGASHGIFLVINVTEAKNLSVVKEAFEKIKNVSVISLNCNKNLFKKKSSLERSKK